MQAVCSAWRKGGERFSTESNRSCWLSILFLPITLEQELTARNVVRLGAGISIDFDETQSDFIAALRELVMNPAYTKMAHGFSRTYADSQEDEIMAGVMRRCVALIADSVTDNGAN